MSDGLVTTPRQIVVVVRAVSCHDMANFVADGRADSLSELLVQLRDSWSSEELDVSAPATLEELVQEANSALAVQKETHQAKGQGPEEPESNSAKSANNTTNNDENIKFVSSSLLRSLCEVARFALDPANAAKARIRTMGLDCLRIGAELTDGGDERSATKVLALAAAGARDERWGVRAAAARLAGAVLDIDEGGCGERVADDRRLLDLLSSKDGLWLPAMLTDGFPEVEQRARCAVGGAGNDPENGAKPESLASTRSNTTVSAPQTRSLWTSAASAVAVHTAREALLVTAFESSHDAEVVDLEVESTARTALRSLRGVSSLALSLSDSRKSKILTQPVIVEALEGIEAWLASMVEEPPSHGLGWVTQGDGTQSSSFPQSGLLAEARVTVSALAACVGDATYVGAAAAATVKNFKDECCGQNGGVEKDIQEADLETMWRRLYSGLQVRLETFFALSDSSTLSSTSDSSSAEGAIRELSGTTPSDGPAALWLAETLAGALQEVPFAHEQAIPTFYDGDDTTANERTVLVQRGEQRRRWIGSCAQVLLHACIRVCERREWKTTARKNISENDQNAAITLLVAALPFQESFTRADDPIKAWLSWVKSDDSPQFATTERLPHQHARRTRETAQPAAGPTSIMSQTSSEIATPVPWQSCVDGRQLHKHQIPALWAADKYTRELATEFIEAVWRALSLDDGAGNVDVKSAEALVQAFRASARTRGWREGSGVGLKHALATATRRLRFPLVAGATLGHLLPLVLPLADDYDPSHQAVGFSLLLHVTAQGTPAELAWHRGLLLEVLERGLRGGGRDTAASFLCLAAAVALLRGASAGKYDSTAGSAAGGIVAKESVGRAGIRMAREALSQGGKTRDGELRVVMVAGAAALLELPATASGYAPCEILRPALLCLLPILQSPIINAALDGRAAALRALHSLCLSCWPRVHAHTAKLLCALLWTCGDCFRRRQANPSVAADRAQSLEQLSSNDDIVAKYAIRLGALVLLLSGAAGRSILREACDALSTLRPVGLAMEELADRSLGVLAKDEQLEPAAGRSATELSASGDPATAGRMESVR